MNRVNRRMVWCVVGGLAIGVCGPVRGQAADKLLERAREGMRKAGQCWATTVASHGGYVWEYSTDLVTRRRGESKDLPASVVWVQSGTPMVGEAFLKAYETTGEKLYLEAALAAGKCLAWGQLASGGWYYSIDFDLKRNWQQYHHLKAKTSGKGKRLRNTTSFDDNNTQSATRFLMHLDRYVDDPTVDAAVERALKCFLKAQYKDGKWDGAWPQRFPPPTRGYGAYPTYNDNTMSDCVRTMLMAHKEYGKPAYLASVKRCLEFYLRSQQPAPQTTWAQQYDKALKPAWARRFEPPSVTGNESCGNCRLLLNMYIEFGDVRYLDAVGKAVDWYKRSRIGGTAERGVWARFYEVGTNKPLYFTRTYKLVYTDDDLPVHYSFKGNYGVNRMMARYEHIKQSGREHFLKARDRELTPADYARLAKKQAGDVKTILDAQDAKGRWVKVVPKMDMRRDKKGRYVRVVDRKTMLPMMYSLTFVRHMRRLADYVTAAQGGPRVKPDPS